VIKLSIVVNNSGRLMICEVIPTQCKLIGVNCVYMFPESLVYDGYHRSSHIRAHEVGGPSL
jgi:hypothetical protein